jgi:hypothetical protein
MNGPGEVPKINLDGTNSTVRLENLEDSKQSQLPAVANAAVDLARQTGDIAVYGKQMHYSKSFLVLSLRRLLS